MRPTIVSATAAITAAIINAKRVYTPASACDCCAATDACAGAVANTSASTSPFSGDSIVATVSATPLRLLRSVSSPFSPSREIMFS